MLGYAFNDEPVQQWVPAEHEPIPDRLLEALLDEDVLKYAWNSAFERYIFKYVLGIDIPAEQWRDPMIMALGVSLPGKLMTCSEVMRLPDELRKTDGRPFITRFSVKRRKWWEPFQWPYWVKFKDYNVHDVLAERMIYKMLRRFDLSNFEWEVFTVDQKINDIGLPINRLMAKGAIRIRDVLMREYLAEMNERTGLVNANSVQQLLPWLQEQGYEYGDVQAAHVRSELQGGNLSDDGLRVLKLRQRVSKISTKKFDAIVAQIDDDDRLRGTIRMNGAGRTNRFSGRVFMPHNLPRPAAGLDGLLWGKTKEGNPILIGGQQVAIARLLETGDAARFKMDIKEPMNAIAGATRTVVQAPDGWMFIVFDWMAIENVLLGWLANDQVILDVFREKRDPYISFAVYLYKRTYDSLMAEYEGGDKSKRTISKPGVLGCGYGLGPGEEYVNSRDETEYTGLMDYARAIGISLTQEQSELSVKTWRDTYHAAVDYWYALERAAIKTVRRGGEHTARMITFDYRKPFLRMTLPTGRSLHYLRPAVENQMKPWGKYKPTLTYEGFDHKTHRWGRISTHPGKIMENADQATAREILVETLVILNEASFLIPLHVHDEIVALVREENVDEDFKIISTIMNAHPEWRRDLPLSASGYISKYFIKD